jgi:two-component system sensor histidine kinase RegB
MNTKDTYIANAGRAAANSISFTERLNLDWLVRLRWGAMAGQVLVFLAGIKLFDLSLSVTPLILILAITTFSNFIISRCLDRQKLAVRSALALLLVLDVGLLSALLYYYGGHTNPFSMMYLVHVVLAALFLGGRWTWVIWTCSTLAYGALFFTHHSIPELEVHHGASTFSFHLHGMLWAFLLIGALLAFFLSRLNAELHAREQEVETLRTRAADEHKLLALTDLAASAAHELGTPLGTIAVSAHEIENTLRRRDPKDSLLEDTGLIAEEIERCHTIVRAMSGRGGELMGEMPGTITTREVIERAKADLSALADGGITVTGNGLDREITTYRESLVATLRTLLKNAIEACGTKATIVIEAAQENLGIRFTVTDNGAGIPTELQKRVGEPFFTTKPVGQGLGLGLFLVTVFARRIGGTFEIQSKEGQGTKAILLMPSVARGAQLG